MELNIFLIAFTLVMGIDYIHNNVNKEKTIVFVFLSCGSIMLSSASMGLIIVHNDSCKLVCEILLSAISMSMLAGYLLVLFYSGFVKKAILVKNIKFISLIIIVVVTFEVLFRNDAFIMHHGIYKGEAVIFMGLAVEMFFFFLSTPKNSRAFSKKVHFSCIFLLICIIIDTFLHDILFFAAPFVLSNFFIYIYRANKNLKTDPLTGLFTRRIIPMACNTLKDNERFIVFLIDVNDFKQVNDKYGHDAGDRILCRLANIISISVKESDYCIRYGGDEFLILVRCKKSTDCEKLSNKILQKIQTSVDINNENSLGCVQEKVTMSVGCAYCDIAGDLEKAIKSADEKMYIKKRELKQKK